MLYIGQVVYDFDNERPLIFCGIELFQEQKEPYNCWSVTAFIDEEGNEYIYAPKEKFTDSLGDKVPFKYSNYPAGADGINEGIPAGFFIQGGFFGCMDPAEILADPEAMEKINRTFKAVKTWIKPVQKVEE